MVSIGQQHARCGDGSKACNNHDTKTYEGHTSMSFGWLGMPDQSSLPAAFAGRMAPRRERPPESEEKVDLRRCKQFYPPVISEFAIESGHV